MSNNQSLLADLKAGKKCNLEAAASIEQLESELYAASALRQQDLARMARMREALEILSAKSDWCASIAEPVLSETSDIQDWMDGKRAQWISAGLNKPKESDGEVLVLMPDGRREIAWASYWHGASNDFARWSFRDPDETDIPTHWMPLPAAPSARSTKGEG